MVYSIARARENKSPFVTLPLNLFKLEHESLKRIKRIMIFFVAFRARIVFTVREQISNIFCTIGKVNLNLFENPIEIVLHYF